MKVYVKTVVGELGGVLLALLSTLRELADSKKAILTALIGISALLVTAYPALSQYKDVVITQVDVWLGVLVLLFGLIDGIKAAKTTPPGTAG